MYTYVTGYRSHPKKGCKRKVPKADTWILEPSTYTGVEYVCRKIRDKKFFYYLTADPSQFQLLTLSGIYTPRKVLLAHWLKKTDQNTTATYD